MDVFEKVEQFETSSFEILKKQEDLLTQFRSLKYSGKELPPYHLFEESLEQVSQAVLSQFDQEEKRAFPFLQKHIPKLEPVIQYLVSEHDDFREHFKELKYYFQKFKNELKSCLWEKTLQKIHYHLTYLQHLFRNHMRAEKKMLLEVSQATLQEDEKSEFSQLY